MIKIERNKTLAPFTTLKVGGKAQYFIIAKTKEELFQALDFAQEKKLAITILGGGSNLLITGAVKGLVIKNEIFNQVFIRINGYFHVHYIVVDQAEF